MKNSRKQGESRIIYPAGITVAACWFFAGRYGAFGANMDWISQHSVFPEYFRQQFYQTGQFFPEFAANIGGGQNIYNFSYYGLYNPVVLVAYLLPFVKPSYVRNLIDGDITTYDEAVRLVIERENIDTAKRNILVSHQFYTAAGREPETSDSEIRMVGGIENVDTAVLEPFDYAALGHIHRKQKIGRVQNRYCGTPLQYSVSEAGDEKTVTMVELLEKGSEPHITELPLMPMRRVRKMIGHLDEILNAVAEDNCHDYVSITLTDEVEAYQPKEKLEQVYDHILEIKIDNERTRKILEFSEEEAESLDPYDAFVTFFQEMNGRAMTEDEDNVIRTVINGEKEVVE